jgi:hypothetical protein
MSRCIMHVLDRYGEATPKLYWFGAPRGSRMNKELVKDVLTKYFLRDIDEEDAKEAVTHILENTSIQMSNNCAHISDEEQDFVVTII